MIPLVENEVSYGDTVAKWWTALQPVERLTDTVSAEGLSLRRLKILDAKSWEPLAKGGKNGFFIFVMVLSWWAIHLDGRKSIEFDAMLGDAVWAIKEAVDALQVTKKRSVEEDGEEDSDEVGGDSGKAGTSASGRASKRQKSC